MGLLDKIKKTEKTDAVKKPAVKVEKKSEKIEAKKSFRPSKAYKTIVKPLLSEKSTALETIGQYTFVVDAGANKTEIKNAVKEIYGINPERVHVINMQGKRVRSGQRSGRRRDFKKATVTLPKGKTISIHEGV